MLMVVLLRYVLALVKRSVWIILEVTLAKYLCCSVLCVHILVHVCVR